MLIGADVRGQYDDLPMGADRDALAAAVARILPISVEDGASSAHRSRRPGMSRNCLARRNRRRISDRPIYVHTQQGSSLLDAGAPDLLAARVLPGTRLYAAALPCGCRLSIANISPHLPLSPSPCFFCFKVKLSWRTLPDFADRGCCCLAPRITHTQKINPQGLLCYP